MNVFAALDVIANVIEVAGTGSLAWKHRALIVRFFKDWFLEE